MIVAVASNWEENEWNSGTLHQTHFWDLQLCALMHLPFLPSEKSHRRSVLRMLLHTHTHTHMRAYPLKEISPKKGIGNSKFRIWTNDERGTGGWKLTWNIRTCFRNTRRTTTCFCDPYCCGEEEQEEEREISHCRTDKPFRSSFSLSLFLSSSLSSFFPQSKTQHGRCML